MHVFRLFFLNKYLFEDYQPHNEYYKLTESVGVIVFFIFVFFVYCEEITVLIGPKLYF